MRFIRKNATAARVGWHPSHLMRKVRAREFPQPVQLGPNSIAFLEDEVNEWMEQRLTERDAKTAQADKGAEVGSEAA